MPGLAIWRGIGWVHALQTDFHAGARSDVPGSGITRALESVESAGIAASYFGYGRGDARPRGRSWLRLTVLEVCGRSSSGSPWHCCYCLLVAGWRPPASRCGGGDAGRPGHARRGTCQIPNTARIVPKSGITATGSATRHTRYPPACNSGYGLIDSPFHHCFSGPSTCTSKCRCGASALALPVLPT